MKFPLSVLFGSLCLLLLSCQEEKKSARKSPPEKIEKKEESKSGKKSLLNVPAGAVITDLTLPYYNKKGRKVSLLTIEELTVNDAEGLAEAPFLTGETLKLWLFDRDQKIRSTTLIPEATYEPETEMLETEGQILMVGVQNQFAAKSQGGFFSLATGQAFLLGPATTRFTNPEK